MSDSIAVDPSPELLTPAIQIDNLRHGDPGERYYAAWWLGRMRLAEGVSALIEALDYAEDRTDQGGYPVRRNAARALGKLQDPQAIPALLLCLVSEDDHLQGAAIQSLGDIGVAYPDQAEPVVAALVDWLQARSSKSLDQGNSVTDPALEAVLETLGTLQVTTAQTLIEPYLDHPSVRIDCAAARALYRITENPSYAERLIPVLDHENVHLRRAALLDLGASGYLAGAEAIAQAAVEVNIKLLALKSMLDLHLARSPQPTPAIIQVLNLLDTLI